MDIQDVVQFIDEAVYSQTGKRLNDLQREVIEGSIKKKKYAEIAEDYGCSAGHAKDVGYELLQMLSDVFDETIDKNNLKSVVERRGNFNISLGDKSINNHMIGYINNFCPDRPPDRAPENTQSETRESQSNKHQDKIEVVVKLREFGLSDDKIAEALGLPLEDVLQIK
jgi:DNA-directed RNA polymerase specialized sigma24 family protein